VIFSYPTLLFFCAKYCNSQVTFSRTICGFDAVMRGGKQENAFAVLGEDGVGPTLHHPPLSRLISTLLSSYSF